MGGSDLDYLRVLKALTEIPFGVGKKLLTDFLQGKTDNTSIQRNNLHKCAGFGCLAYEDDEIAQLVADLYSRGFIRYVSVNGKHWWRVLEITQKGIDEIENPTLSKEKEALRACYSDTKITDDDQKKFEALGDVLEGYNDEQKKAIITPSKRVLCIAGAGSGKTTVLTKRAEFLSKYRSVEPQNILAITFTRKARKEMQQRIPEQNINIETFNSFCEKILRKHNNLAYKKQMKVASYSDKIRLVKQALREQKISIDKATDLYFTYAQKRNKTAEQLFSIMVNDCFFVRDYFKSKNRKIERALFKDAYSEHKQSAELVFQVSSLIEKYMQEKGLRDFADQLTDALALFSKHPETIPQFDHVLVDEYQDVNLSQIKLLDCLNPTSLFVVGDPRQSIYGWRGSDIKHIIDFQKDNPGSEVITLKKNYRSTAHIVGIANKAIKHMGVSDMEAVFEGPKDMRLLKFETETSEYEFIIQRLLMEDNEGSETFILARTNRQLNELSDVLKARRIKHIVRSDELRKPIEQSKEAITLATVHAIKGMEADTVYIIGASGANFPCKGSEHPVVDMVRVDEYDKEEEEKRLFYVALSRAKKSLYITYSSKKPTRFLTNDLLKELNASHMQSLQEGFKDNIKAGTTLERLKQWRKNKSLELGVPAYIIMTDKTVLDLIQKEPASMKELESVHGLGPSKITRYGREILDQI